MKFWRDEGLLAYEEELICVNTKSVGKRDYLSHIKTHI